MAETRVEVVDDDVGLTGLFETGSELAGVIDLEKLRDLVSGEG